MAEPFGELKAYEPSWRDQLTGLIARAMGDDRTSFQRAQKITGIADFLPGVGTGLAIDDTARDLDAGDWLGAGFSAMGVIPGAGKLTGKVGKALRKGDDFADLFRVVPDDPAQLTPKGKDPEWFHAVGGKPKLQRPFSEMTSTTVPSGEMTPRRQIDPAELQGGLLLPLYGDKTAAGQTLTHINDEALPRPQALQGGAGFMQENPGQIWASEPGAPLSMLSRKARGLHEQTGKPVYGVHVAMGPQGSDFARMTTRPLLDMAKEAPVKRADLKLFDEEMRGELGGVKGQRWPGLMKADDDWLANASGADRATLAKIMQLASHQNAGFPDVGSLRKAITDPELVNRPMLTTGRTVGKFDPMATLSPSWHDTYGMGIAGDYQGDLGALPIEAVFQDFMKTRPPGEQLPLTGRTVSTQLPVQEANQQWLDSLMRLIEGRAK